MPKLSIIIGAYQAQNFIEECLNSISVSIANCSGNFEFEILLGIDGCRDTLATTARLSRVEHLKIFYFPQNNGVYIVKNSLLTIAQGDFVLFFDADDKMNPEMIQRCFELGAPLVIGEDGVTFWKKSHFDLTGGFMPWRCAADTEHRIRFERITGSQVPRCKTMFYYRKHKGSITNNADTSFASSLREKYKSIIDLDIIPDKIKTKTAYFKNVLDMNKEKIYCGIASFPAREKSLEKVIQSILPQVDHLFVYLNEYATIPSFLLNNPAITVYQSQNCSGDLGDVGKFYYLHANPDLSGYCLTIDDDLIYAPGYVDLMISTIEKYNRKNIVSCHGRRFHSYPLKSLYKDPYIGANCTKGNKEDIDVHFGGTGVMAFHSDTIRFNLSDFTYINMADVFVGIKAQKHNVRITCPVFPVGLITVTKESDVWFSIWASCYDNDSIQTNLINENYDY